MIGLWLIWRHRWFGWHWWYEHRLDGKDVRLCHLCPIIQERERNYDPRTGHYYTWTTITEIPNE